MKRGLLFLLLAAALLSAPVIRVRASTQLAQEHEQESDSEESEQPVLRPSVVTPTTTPPPTTTVTNVTDPVVSDAATTTPVTSASTTSTVAPVATVSASFPWPWIIARAMGIASYVLLSILSITGILLTMGALYRIMSPATAWSLHRAIGSVLLFSVLVHISALRFDTFIRLRTADILIPFVSHYQPILVALGIIGFYILLFVLASSLYTMTSHAKFWRTVHFFAFPMYILIFLHSILLGTDAHHWWMKLISWGSFSALMLTVLYRLWWKYRPAKRFINERSG